MRVYKREACWYADFRDAAGTRQRRSLGQVTGGERMARARAVEAIQAHNASLAATLAADGGKPLVPLRSALLAYADSLRAEGKPSARSAAMHANKTFAMGAFEGRFGFPESTMLHALTPAMLGKLVAARRAEGNGAQAIAHEIKDLRAATRHAAADGYRIPEDMLNGALRNAWRMPQLVAKTRYLTREELDRLLAYLDPARALTVERGGKTMTYDLVGASRAGRQDNYDLAVCLAYGGERWGEITALRWDQVDTDALASQDGAVVTLTVYGRKTQSHRMVGCPEAVCQVLRRRLEARLPGQPLVFPSSKTGKGRTAGNAAIIRAMDKLGLNAPEKVRESGRATVHSLRHTYASLLLQNGASLPEIQDALGHTSMAMTRRYAHLARKESAGRLAGILNGL